MFRIIKSKGHYLLIIQEIGNDYMVKDVCAHEFDHEDVLRIINDLTLLSEIDD